MIWRALGIILLGLGLASAVLLVQPTTLFDLERFAFPKELALNLTALVVLGLLALRRAFRLGVVEWALIVLAAWSALSAILATNQWLGLRSAALTTSGVAIYLGVRALVTGGPSATARRGLGWLLVAIVVTAVGTGIAEANGWESQLLAQTRAPGGLLGNRNFMAHLGVLGLPLVGWLTLSSRRRTTWLLGTLMVAGVITFVVLSRSRAAWLGLGVVVATGSAAVLLGAWGQSERSSRGAFLALAGGGAAGVLAVLVMPHQLRWKSETPYRDSLRDVVNYREGSGHGRLIQYRNSLELVRMDPVFGTGPGNWAVKYPLVTTPGDPSFAAADPMPTNPWPSSDWVALLVERGPIGAALGIVAGLAMMLVAGRRLRAPELDERTRAAMVLALQAGVVVMGAFDAVLMLVPPTAVVMAGLAAMLPETRPIGESDQTPGRHRLLATGAILWTALATFRSGVQVASLAVAGTGSPRERLERAARVDPASYRLEILLTLRSRCPAALDHARRAAELMPFHPMPASLARPCGGLDADR